MAAGPSQDCMQKLDWPSHYSDETTPKGALMGTTSAPKWEQTTKKRLADFLKSQQQTLAKLKQDDANEATIRLVVTELLNKGLGYDLVGELAPEYMVRGEFADFGIRIDQGLVAFLEVKRPGTKLDQKHLRQVQSYAVNEGVEWLWLTNGPSWQVWHLSGGLPVTLTLVLEVDLLDGSTAAKQADRMFLITRESMKRRQIDELWAQRAALSGDNLRSVLLSGPVLQVIRRELRKSTGYLAPLEDLQDAVESGLK